MENQEEVIYNKNLLGNIIKSLFVNLPVSMIYNNEEIAIRVICVEKEFILIRSTGRTDREERILTFTNNGSLYHFYFEYTDKSTEELEYLEPVKLIVRKHALRKQKRTIFLPSSNSYITNFILDSQFHNSLSENILWIKALNETLFSLRSKFKFAGFQFYEETNLRFIILKYTGKPIFFPRNDWVPANPSFSDIKPIRKVLKDVNWNEVKGPEITLPAMYRSKKLVGALIVKHNQDLEMGDYTLVNMLFSFLQRELNKNKKLAFSNEECKIIDISIGGVGFIVERQETFSYFEVGREMIVEIYLAGVSALLSLIIRNTRMLDEKKLRVGAEFKDIGQEERVFIQNFYSNI